MPYRPLLTGAKVLKSAPQLGYIGLHNKAAIGPEAQLNVFEGMSHISFILNLCA